MKKIFSVIIAAMALFTGCTAVEETVVTTVTEEAVPAIVTTAASTTTATVTTTTAEPVPEYATVSVAAVGDNLIHSSLYKQAAERAGGDGYDFEYAYQNTENLIRRADLSIINQETLICNGLYEPSTYPRFNSPPELGEHMLDMGFDVFTIANNHTLDMGEDGLYACLDYWDGKDAVVCGVYRNAADRADIRTKEVNGITFSFLSYTELLNGLSLPAGSELQIGDAYDVDTMVTEIKAAKEVSDVCVVALHWGVENSDIISDYQRDVAGQLANAGADVIIGNHPHVLRDIEEIQRKDGSVTLCAYSLGNFISAQSVGQNLIGGILQFDISMRLDQPEPVIIDNIELVPVITHYDGSYHDVRVYPLSDYTRELADSHGVRSMSTFGYDYIFQVLERNISPEYFDRSEYYKE